MLKVGSFMLAHARERSRTMNVSKRERGGGFQGGSFVNVVAFKIAG